MRTDSVIAFLCLLAIAAMGLILLPQSSFTPEQGNSTGLIKEQPEQADKALEKPFDSAQGKQVKVDLSLQKAYLFENGEIVQEYSISSGAASTPTPIGQFKIVYKSPEIYSQINRCWLSFWAGFTENGKYGFHETPVCDGQREGEDMIGQPDSSGCLRLKVGDAQDFYGWIEKGVTVDIY